MADLGEIPVALQYLKTQNKGSTMLSSVLEKHINNKISFYCKIMIKANFKLYRRFQITLWNIPGIVTQS